MLNTMENKHINGFISALFDVDKILLSFIDKNSENLARELLRDEDCSIQINTINSIYNNFYILANGVNLVFEADNELLLDIKNFMQKLKDSSGFKPVTIYTQIYTDPLRISKSANNSIGLCVSGKVIDEKQ